jgi:DNA ligase-1
MSMRLYRPINVMRAQLAQSIDKVLDEMGTVAVEWKYDGTRVQIHSGKNGLQIWSRRLENITKALPEVAEICSSAIGGREVVLDGEAVATGDDGKPMPFQQILRRIRRKYDVKETAKEIPLRLYLFDILYLDGETLVDLPLTKRRQLLDEVVNEIGDLSLSEQLVSSDKGDIDAVYRAALAAGHEGVMIKNPDSAYTPGLRGKNWLKWKKEMETLDLVVVGAEWGEGKRAGVLGTYLLACRDDNTGELLEIGKVATGFSEEELAQFTDIFRHLIEYEDGVSVRIRPEVVFEVGYDELQKSPSYSSGFALRFPRLVRMRDDRNPKECDTISRVEEMYAGQKE